MLNIDIIEIDSIIRKFLTDDINENYNSNNEILDQINVLLNTSVNNMTKYKLLQTKSMLIEKNKNIRNDILFFYLLDTIHYIEKYKQIISVPIKVNFMGKKNSVTSCKEKEDIIKKYTDISNKYIETLKIPINIKFPEKNSDIIKCNSCGSNDITEKDFDFYVCNNCYSLLYNTYTHTSYKDINRVNMNNRYMYIRRSHFKDCIMQFQGKQSVIIPQIIYDNLEKQLEKHYLLNGNKQVKKEIRYKNVTKKHIIIFLKELGYSKHYENINLIHYNLTGQKPHDISHLEDVLLNDFEILTELYDKRFCDLNRRNFINIHYVLFQLLHRHNYPYNNNDKVTIKTLERKYLYDEICKQLFEELGWNHHPFY